MLNVNQIPMNYLVGEVLTDLKDFPFVQMGFELQDGSYELVWVSRSAAANLQRVAVA